MEDNLAKNGELKKLEEGLPSVKEGKLEEVSRWYKAKTGMGCDGFHAKVPLGVTKETRVEVLKFLEKVEQNGKWPQEACTDDVLLDAEECHK